MGRKSRNYYNRRKAHFAYIWRVSCADKDACYCSPEFTIPSMDMTKWRVDVTLYDDGTPALGNIRRLNDDGPKSIQIEFEIEYFGHTGCATLRSSACFLKNSVSGDGMFSDMCGSRSCSKDCCPNDSVTVRCQIWRKGAHIPKSELCFASTQFDVYKRQCVWAVKRISSVLKGEKRTRVLNGKNNGCPELILSLSLAEINGKEFVALEVEATHLTDTFVIKADISLLDDEGKPFLARPEEVILIFPPEHSSRMAIFAESDFKCHHSMSDDILLLQCKLKISTGDPVLNGTEDYRFLDYSPDLRVFQQEEGASQCETNETAICPVKENVSKYMEDGTLSDVCLRAGTKSFPVHKFILSSRSSAFKKLFTSDTCEETSNECIDIPDLDAETLKHLLFYIYRDEVQELTWETAANLLKASVKYELLDLKEKCSCVLKSSLSESNICEILILANESHDESLLNSVQEYIQNNSAIIRSDVWKVFKQTHSELALETTEQIICNLK